MRISVVPAKAGTHCGSGESCIPAFGGMTSLGVIFRRAAGDEKSRIALKTLRVRSLAEFTLESTQSEVLRCAQDESEGLGMTA